MADGNHDEQSKLDALVAEVFGDFPTFCSLLTIHTKSADLGDIPFHFESWHEEQVKFQRERTGRDIVLKPRQVGFSTLELARDLWFAIVHPGVNVLVIVHDGPLGEQLFLTLRHFAKCLEKIGLLPKKLYSSKREIVFANTGSAVRIVEAGKTEDAASGKGRSGKIHRLHATEVAFWGAAQTTFGAIMAAVGDDEIVIESTADGVGGVFYDDVQAAREGRSREKLHFFPWYEHSEYRAPVADGFDATPRDDWEKRLRGLGCDDEQIQWWRHKVDDPKTGIERALAEYPVDIDTCFRFAGRQYYPADVIDKLTEQVREPIATLPLLHGERIVGIANIFAHPAMESDYVIGADIAEGIVKDGSSATVGEWDTGAVVATLWSDTTEPGDFGLALAALAEHYNHALVAPERNNHGHATIRALTVEAGYNRVYYASDKKLGWSTNPATRSPMFDELNYACREGVVQCPCAATIRELRTLVIDDDGKPRARGKNTPGGCLDDRAVSFAITWQVRSRSSIDTGGVGRVPGRYSS